MVKFSLVTLCALTAASNMNGKYEVSSVGDIGAAYNSDYASKVSSLRYYESQISHSLTHYEIPLEGYEYFDVWGPEIATHYGEVFWTDQGTNPIPANIIKRFEDKVIAIQGYEQDQVMVSPQGQPGVNPEKDVSVPINW